MTTSADALGAALDAGAIGTWRWIQAEGRLEWDAAMLRLLGIDAGQFDGRVESWAGAVHPDDLDRVLDLLAHAIEQAGPVRLEHRVRRADGEVRWLDGFGTPVVGADGELAELVGFAEDVTERTVARRDREALLAQVTARAEAERVQRERLELVASVNQALEEGGDLDELALRVATAVVPKLADWCSVYLLPVEGDVVPDVTTWHSDPTMVDYARTFQSLHPYDVDAEGGVPAVIRSGSSTFHPEITDDLMQAADADPEQVQIVRELHLRSAMTVALRKEDRVLGAIQFLMTSEHRRYTSEDLTLAEAIAARIAATLENRRLRALRDRVASIDAHLAELGRQLAGAPHTDDVLAVINAEAAGVLGADAVRVGLVIDAEHLSISSPHGRGSVLLDLSADDPMCEAARTGRSVFATLEDAAVVASPLYDDDRRSIGVVSCTWSWPKAFDQVDGSAVETLSRLCGQSLRRSQLAAQTTDLADLAASMANARTATEVATVVRDYGIRCLQAMVTNLRVLDHTTRTLRGIVPSSLDPRLADRYHEVATSDDVPVSAAARRNVAVLLPDLATYEREFPDVAADARLAGVGAAAAIPLHTSAGEVIGVVAFAWPAAMTFDTALELRLSAVCDLAAQTLERANLHEAEHAVVDSMQRRLLPPLPHLDALATQAFYEPAASAVGMGGDWYGGVALPDGSFVAIIGDVVGHGVEAVAAMAQLQHLTTGLIRTGTPLSEVMARTNDVLADGEPIYASAVLLHVDPTRAQLGYVNAGHPWPLLRLPDGTVQVLAEQHHSLLGTPIDAEPLTYVPFVEGAAVFAYTDGLIEHRDESITDGMHRLVDAWQHVPDAHDISTIVAAVRRTGNPETATNDDTAGILVRYAAVTAPLAPLTAPSAAW